MSDVKTEVSDRLAAYVEAFTEMSGKRSSDYYNIPMTFISNEGVENYTDRVELGHAIDHYRDWMKERGYERVELSSPQVTELNPSHAAAVFELIGYDSAGSRVGVFDATYAFIKDTSDGEWRIVVATILNHSELNELNT